MTKHSRPVRSMPSGRSLTRRDVNWIKAAQRDFEKFPQAVQSEGLRVLTVTAEGVFADGVKPLKGFREDVYEVVLKHRGDAFRVVYVLQLGEDVWVVHAFQKKSTKGIETPQHHIELIRERIKRLKESLS